jgi:hypothetical protein
MTRRRTVTGHLVLCVSLCLVAPCLPTAPSNISCKQLCTVAGGMVGCGNSTSALLLGQ